MVSIVILPASQISWKMHLWHDCDCLHGLIEVGRLTRKVEVVIPYLEVRDETEKELQMCVQLYPVLCHGGLVA